MKLTPEQQARARDFKSLMSQPGWVQLMTLADNELERSRNAQDKIRAEDLNINHVCEERGYRNGIRWLIQQALTIGEVG